VEAPCLLCKYIDIQTGVIVFIRVGLGIRLWFHAPPEREIGIQRDLTTLPWLPSSDPYAYDPYAYALISSVVASSKGICPTWSLCAGFILPITALIRES